MGTNENQDKAVSLCKQRITALQKYTPGIATLSINGTTYTPDQLEAVYQGSIDKRALVTTERGALHGALAARKEADVVRRAVDVGLKGWVTNTFGPTSQAMTDFGFVKPARQKRSAEAKAQAVAKGQATRKARHTMGKRQKAKVHADAATPAAPEAPAAPEPTAKPPANGA